MHGREETWALAARHEAKPDEMVSLRRVLRQRAAMLEMAARALRYSALEDLLADAARLAAEGIGVEIAKIAARQPDGDLLLVAGWNLDPGLLGVSIARGDATNPAGQSMVERRVVVVPDVRQCPSYHLPPVFPEHGIVASANVPIISQSRVFGVLEVDSRQARAFDALDETFLTLIAGIIAEGVERVQREGALNRAVTARETLLREHHHRVRNSYQVLLALLHKHGREAGTADARERFQHVEHRLFGLISIYDHLLGGEQGRSVVLQDYLDSLCVSLREFYSMDERGITLDYRRTEALTVDVDTATALGIVVNELVANSVEHAFAGAGGKISVCAERTEGSGASIVVSDNGRGFIEEEHETIGLATVRRLLAQIGASLDVATAGGTRWLIDVPPDRAAAVLAYGGNKPRPPQRERERERERERDGGG